MLRRYTTNGTETLELSGKVTTIGSANCDIIIEDSSLDPQHAIIEMDPSTRCYWIKDLNTSSGSIINNQQIIDGQQLELRSGDKIRLGYDESEYIFENNKKRQIQPRRRVWSGGAATGLPNLHNNQRRESPSPSTQKLVLIDGRDLVRPIIQNRSRVGGFRERTILAGSRGSSLDRTKQRKRMITSAWASASPESSGSWDRNNYSALAKRNSSQAMRYMQQRIIQLEAALQRESSNGDSGLLLEERSKKEDYLMEKLRRLEQEVTHKDMEIVSLRDTYDLENGDPISEEIADLRQLLERSEREKAELRVNLSKAQNKLEERHEVITEIVNGNMNNDHGLRNFDNIYDGDLGLSSSFSKFGQRNEMARDFSSTGRGAQIDFDSDFETESRLKIAEIAVDVQSVLLSLVMSEFQKYLDAPDNVTDVMKLVHEVAMIQPVVSLENKYTDYEVKIRQELLKKPESPLKDPKYTEEDLQEIDQEISKALKGPWKEVLESGARWLPQIVECSREMSKLATLRESFAEWTVEVRETFFERPISSAMLHSFADKLTERFDSAGVGNHWLLSSLGPMLNAAAKQFHDYVEAKFFNREDAVVNTEMSLDDLEELSRRQTELQEEISKRDESLHQYERAVEEAEKAKERLTEASKNLETEIQRLETESATVQTEFDRLFNDNKALRDSNDKISVEKAELQAEIISLTGKLEESLKRAENVGKMEGKIRELTEKLKKSENNLGNMWINEKTQLENRIAELKKKVEESGRNSGNMLQWENEKTQLESRIAELAEICEAKDVELELLRKKSDSENNSDTEELEKVKRKLEEFGGGRRQQTEILKSEKQEKELEMFELRERIAELENERDELKSLQEKEEDQLTIPNLPESLQRTEELEKQLREKEETNILLNDRLMKTIGQLDSFRAQNGESQTSTMLKENFQNSYPHSNQEIMDQSFWNLSNQLADLLKAETQGNDKLSSNGQTNENKDPEGTAKEVVSKVQELLDRVRKQNDELTTFRGQDSERNGSNWKESLGTSNGGFHLSTPNISPEKKSKQSKNRQKREKKDLPMKIVTFDIP